MYSEAWGSLEVDWSLDDDDGRSDSERRSLLMIVGSGRITDKISELLRFRRVDRGIGCEGGIGGGTGMFASVIGPVGPRPDVVEEPTILCNLGPEEDSCVEEAVEWAGRLKKCEDGDWSGEGRETFDFEDPGGVIFVFSEADDVDDKDDEEEDEEEEEAGILGSATREICDELGKFPEGVVIEEEEWGSIGEDGIFCRCWRRCWEVGILTLLLGVDLVSFEVKRE